MVKLQSDMMIIKIHSRGFQNKEDIVVRRYITMWLEAQ